MTNPIKLPRLFKTDTSGKPRTWYIEVYNDQYRTVSGAVGAKLTEGAWRKAEAKNVGRANEISAANQAALEAQRAWEKKVQEGYVENLELSDVAPLLKPMLAKNYEDYQDEVDGVFANNGHLWSQPKLDGVRCLLSKKGAFSRSGKEIPGLEHIVDALAPFLEDMTLDGELYIHGVDFNWLSGVIRKGECAQHEVEYHVYDLVDPDREFSARYEALIDVVLAAEQEDPELAEIVFLVPTSRVGTEEELDGAYELYTAQGYEGQMIRFDIPYQHKRTSGLLKRKEKGWRDAEYEIVAVIPGAGTHANNGVLVLRWNDETFTANAPGNFAMKEEILRNKEKYIGQFATVKHFGDAIDNKPRFPIVKGIGRIDQETNE